MTVMKLSGVSEHRAVAPPARYPFQILGAELKTAKSGAAMINISAALTGPDEYAGDTFMDWLCIELVDGVDDKSRRSAIAFASNGKKKLRGLGINVDAPDGSITAEQIINLLVGLNGYVDLGNEPRMEETVKGSKEYDKPVLDMVNGKQVPALKIVPKGYYTHNVQAESVASPGVVNLQAQQANALLQQQVLAQGHTLPSLGEGAIVQQGLPQQQLVNHQQLLPQGQFNGGYPVQQQANAFPGAPGFAAPQFQAGIAPQGLNGGLPAGAQGQALPWTQAPANIGIQAEAGGGAVKRGKK